MSSHGMMREMTPLLPWRPAILSPGWSLRFTATKTLTIFITPGGSSSPRCSFSTLFSKRAVELADRIVHLLFQRLDVGHPRLSFSIEICRHDGTRVLGQHLVGDLGPRLHPLRPAERRLAQQQFLEPDGEAALEDRALVVAVLGQPLDLGALDRQRALVLVDAAAREHPHFDDRAGHARRQAQRGVAHVGGLLAENRAQQFLLRRHRRFALGRDLADQDVARLHLGADIDDAGLVEVLERLLADIGDVAGDLLLAELGVAGHHLEFFDMDRGEHVVGDDALGDQDRILEIVAVPRHERAQARCARAPARRAGSTARRR